MSSRATYQGSQPRTISNADLVRQPSPGAVSSPRAEVRAIAGMTYLDAAIPIAHARSVSIFLSNGRSEGFDIASLPGSNSDPARDNVRLWSIDVAG